MAINFPTDYDTEVNTFADLQDLILLALAGGVTASATTITVDDSALVALLRAGTPITFGGDDGADHFEVVSVAGPAAGNDIPITRAAEGTTATSHMAGTKVTQEPTAGTYNMLKEVIMATQRYCGLVGSGEPGGSPEPGEFYLDQASEDVYACIVSGIWTKVTRPNHNEYTGSGSNADDGHTIYYTLAGEQTYHSRMVSEDGLQHLTNPTTHDHSGGVMGTPVRKFRSGIAVPPPVQSIGDVYFNLGTKALYFSPDGANWELYSTLPKGTILMFDHVYDPLYLCPKGWERVVEMDGNFPRGAATNQWTGLTTGGTATHVHQMPTLFAHKHSFDGGDLSVADHAGHQHPVPDSTGSSGGSVPYDSIFASTRTVDTDSVGDHTHTVTIPQHDTLNYGQSIAETDVNSNDPAYQTLLFCRKL